MTEPTVFIGRPNRIQTAINDITPTTFHVMLLAIVILQGVGFII